MGCRACRSPRRPFVPHEGRGGRLPGGLRGAFRSPGSNRRPGGRARQGRRPVRRDGRRAAGSRPTTWWWPRARTSAPGSRPSPPSSIRRSCRCTPANTGILPSCGRAASSSWAPATRGPRSPWRRPAVTGPGCRGGTPGTNRPAPGAGRTGWSRPLIWFVATHVLTVKTPIGRKVQRTFRSRGLPLARVRRKDLTAAGIELVPRTAGVRDGSPGAGGRTGPRGRERDLVHGIRAGPHVDRPSGLRRGRRTGARPRGRGIRARPVLHRARTSCTR